MTTDSEPDEVEQGLEQNWKFTNAIADRVTELETWRTATEAVATWRRWVIPLALSLLAIAVSVLNLVLLSGHK